MTTAAVALDSVFVDTNILVAANVATSPIHSEAVAMLQTMAGKGVAFWINRQVLREYLASLSRPQNFTKPLPMAALLADVARFQAQFSVAEDGPAVTARLLALLASVPCGGRQVYDANIVATMQAHGIPRLLTHNIADFRRFGAAIAVVPLVPPP